MFISQIFASFCAKTFVFFSLPLPIFLKGRLHNLIFLRVNDARKFSLMLRTRNLCKEALLFCCFFFFQCLRWNTKKRHNYNRLHSQQSLLALAFKFCTLMNLFWLFYSLSHFHCVSCICIPFLHFLSPPILSSVLDVRNFFSFFFFIYTFVDQRNNWQFCRLN